MNNNYTIRNLIKQMLCALLPYQLLEPLSQLTENMINGIFKDSLSVALNSLLKLINIVK